ncbi:MAG TPA: hypothetical protein VGG74_11755 [Kofleriaceae bacterium]|jgi:hypothetical protein
MSDETTTTTLDDLVNASLVEPTIILALSEQPGLYRFCREFNAIGKPTNALKIPTETSYWGSANDRGAGVATAFNATEATALGNTAYSTSSVTATAAEYGVAHSLTDNVGEDSAIDGAELLDLFQGRMLHVLSLAMEDDYLALLVSLSQTVGISGDDLTVPQAISGQQGIRIRGAVADQLAYIFDNQQSLDLEAALSAASTSMAVFALAADRLINYMPTPDNGMNTSRQFAQFRGLPAYATGMTDTANTGADVVGACVCPSSAFNDASGATTHGMIWKRLPRFETQRFVRSRATDLIMTARAGFAELQDGSGTAIITDAP